MIRICRLSWMNKLLETKDLVKKTNQEKQIIDLYIYEHVRTDILFTHSKQRNQIGPIYEHQDLVTLKMTKQICLMQTIDFVLTFFFPIKYIYGKIYTKLKWIY